MSPKSRVTLPPNVPDAIQVFVNGVPQRAGQDFRREGDELVFDRSLAKEGKLGVWRWAALLLGVHGTYKKNDQVDVVFQAQGRPVHLTGLDIATE